MWWHVGADAACALACWYPPQYSHLLEPYLHAERRHSRGGGSQPPSPRAGTPDPAGSPPGSPPGAARLRDKWWADADEPLYLVVTPAAVVEGRPCDTDDQVRWLLQQGELSAAVAAAEGAPYVRPETWQACASVYVEHLLACGDVDGASVLCVLRAARHAKGCGLCAKLFQTCSAAPRCFKPVQS